MRFPRLGACNLALVSLYFAPVWGTDGFRALTSPFSGFEDRAHAAATVYFRQLFDFGLDGLLRTSNVLAGLKLVIAAGFVAYLIEFARAIAVRREPDRGTTDAVLALAVAAIVLWALPALATGDAALTRLYATQLLLIAGAVVIITVERHMEVATPGARIATAAEEREEAMRAYEQGRLAPVTRASGPWMQRFTASRRSKTPAGS